MKKRTLIFSLLLVGILSVALSVGITMAKYFSKLESETPFDIEIGEHTTYYTYAVLENDPNTNTKTALSIRNRKAVIVDGSEINKDTGTKYLIDKDGTYELGTNGEVYALPTSNGYGTTTKDQPIAKGTTPDGANDGWTMVHNGYGGAVGAKAVSVTFDDTVYLQGDLRELFQGWPVLESVNLEKADFSDVTVVYKLFDNCQKLKNITFSQYVNLSKVDSLNTMFYLLPVLETLDLSGFNTCNVTNMSSMITSCGLTSLNVSGWTNDSVTNMSSMFSNNQSLTTINLSGFKTTNVEKMNSMFDACKSLTSIDLSNFDTSKVTTMNRMFYSCKAATSITFGSTFNTSNVTDMGSMFQDCNNLSVLDLGGFETSKVTSMGSMFSYCNSLKNLDLSSFNTHNVTSMSSMFNACQSLTSIVWNPAKFVTSNVTSMSSMFSNCRQLSSVNLTNFDTRSVRSMDGMFSTCHSLTIIDLSSFDTANVTNMGNMFYDCKSTKTIYASSHFVTDNVTSSGNMFIVCSSLIGGNKTTLKTTGNVLDKTYARIDKEGQQGYFTEHQVDTWTDAKDGIMHYGTCIATHNGTDKCDATVYELHTFEDGKCTKCEHHEHEVSTWANVTVYTHSGNCTVEGCGISVTESHTFDEHGICTLCSRKCTHSNPGWNSNDAEMHRKVCAYCKLTIQSGEHNFNSEGKCTVCSYQCKHTELSECTPNEDGTTHSGTCTTCKNVVTKEHTFTDGKCVCGKE